jgi:hypothetical protein
MAYQYSNLSLPHPTMASSFDVYWGFSRQFQPVLQESHSTIPYFVEAGYPFDDGWAAMRVRSSEVRARLGTAGARFVICLFDENWSDSRYSAWTRQSQIRFFEFFLGWLLTDTTLGLVIKTQYSRSTPDNFVELAALARAAEQSGRLYVYNDDHHVIRNRPAEAAMAADLAVNLVSGATAGLESALAGVRTVLLDLHGYPLSPIAEWGGPDVVLKSYASLQQAVAGYRRGEAAYARLGDWSPFIDKFDPFRDGRAGERMREFLSSLSEALAEGQSSAQALAAAVARYAAHWGPETVRKGAPGFDASDPLTSQLAPVRIASGDSAQG